MQFSFLSDLHGPYIRCRLSGFSCVVADLQGFGVQSIRTLLEEDSPDLYFYCEAHTSKSVTHPENCNGNAHRNFGKISTHDAAKFINAIFLALVYTYCSQISNISTFRKMFCTTT